ncbi:MAG: radical SAM protein [Puniceicoccales bacterium]|nr:radical SAM protein [Puniceicoccales bacterium]
MKMGLNFTEKPVPPPAEPPAAGAAAGAAGATAPTAADAAGDAETPLAIYIHVPFCRSRCSFCPFYINPASGGFSADYAALLRKDIATGAARHRDAIGARKVCSVFVGGGTPSDLDAADLAGVLRQLRDTFAFAPDAEVTVEGRVRGFTVPKAEAFIAAGANRFSIGVQSTDTALRRRIGRLADRAEVRETLNALAFAGDAGAVIVLDLIYGFPTQTSAHIVEDVRFLAEETAVAGLDLYELRDFPNSPLSKAVAAGHMPPPANAAARAEMLAAGNLALLQRGFEPFYDRHWRRDARERSVYNQLAKRRDADLLAFGAGAGGRLQGRPLSRPRSLDAYRHEVATGGAGGTANPPIEHPVEHPTAHPAAHPTGHPAGHPTGHPAARPAGGHPAWIPRP